MAAKSYKLYYFDGMGLGEVIRLQFALANVPFEDIRFSEEEWPKYKQLSQFGTAPFLDIDGKKYCQSAAINSYLAKEFGFYGTTSLDALAINQVQNLVLDMIHPAEEIYVEKDKAKQAELLQKFTDVTRPRFLGNFEQLLKQNGTGYVVGDQLTLGDLQIFDVITGWLGKYFGPDPTREFPLVKALVDKVWANPRIKAYMASRKVTDV